MADTHTFDVKKSVSDSVVDLFDTMLDMVIEPMAADEIPEMAGRRMIGTLGFAGEVIGSISLEVTQAAGRAMTAAMLGMAPEEIEDEEEIRDVIREACNIIGGNLKSGLQDVGLTCAITTPSITHGDSFEMETLNMDRYDRFGFRFGEHALGIELAVKAAEGVAPERRARLTAVDIHKFTHLGIIESTGDTVIELFDVMLGMPVEPIEDTASTASGESRILGQINFAGQVKGSLELMVAAEFAFTLAGSMLGMEPDEIGEEEVRDVIGEISNIIAGNLKAAFNDSGLTCKISPPNITHGTDFTTEIANMDRYERYCFEHDGNRIFVKVCAKIDESSKVDIPDSRTTAKDSQAIVDAVSLNAKNQMHENPSTGTPPATETDPEASEDGDSNERDLTKDALDLILDIPLELIVELGRTRMKIENLLRLGPGSAVIHSNLEGEPLDILANDTLIARGEVIVENEKYGVRITEIVSSRERLESLRRDPFRAST